MRKPGSDVRKRIVDILFVLKKAHGYEIAKIYNKLFPKVSVRLIYYHLNKGLSLEEFKVENIRNERGNFSWGDKVERKYYSLGRNASPNPSMKLIERVKRLAGK